jgi:CHAT domain-containing protein
MVNSELTPAQPETKPSLENQESFPTTTEPAPEKKERLIEGEETNLEKPAETIEEEKEPSQETPQEKITKKFKPAESKEKATGTLQQITSLIEKTAQEKGIDAAMRLIQDKKLYEQYGPLLFDGLGHDLLTKIKAQLPEEEKTKLNKL